VSVCVHIVLIWRSYEHLYLVDWLLPRPKSRYAKYGHAVRRTRETRAGYVAGLPGDAVGQSVVL
jgi:hypothetical protein